MDSFEVSKGFNPLFHQGDKYDMFERPWGRPPVDICTASCSNSVLSPAKPFQSQLGRQKSAQYNVLDLGRGHSGSGKIRVAAPERESAKEKKSGNNGEKPMIYAEEKVEYADGAVVKVIPSRADLWPSLIL